MMLAWKFSFSLLSSVYACDAINRAGAEALGRDVEHGLSRIREILS